jgi:hypothetical protein
MLRKRFIIYKISRSICFCIIRIVFFTTYEFRNVLHFVQKPIYCEKDLLFTKSVEASTFVQSEWYFSQHIDLGKCFAHSDLM